LGKGGEEGNVVEKSLFIWEFRRADAHMKNRGMHDAHAQRADGRVPTDPREGAAVHGARCERRTEWAQKSDIRGRSEQRVVRLRALCAARLPGVFGGSASNGMLLRGAREQPLSGSFWRHAVMIRCDDML
jgi:hypothetical protein